MSFLAGFLIGFILLICIEWMVPVTNSNGKLTVKYKRKLYILVEANIDLPNDLNGE